MNQIYLDNAATTKLDPKVLEVMNEAAKYYGNPSSIHSVGSEASKRLLEARDFVAFFLGCESEEVIFTSGGSESDNLAIRGIVDAYLNQESGSKDQEKPHVITSAIEHHAVLHTIQQLEKEGKIEATYLDPATDGRIAPEAVTEAITDNTVLVSIMYVNNETGTVQPIRKIGTVIEAANQGRENKIYFHTDAVQAAEFFELSPQYLKVDLLTITAHKIHGPKGVGVLYVRRGTKLRPQITGGSHELRLRAGTENLMGISGLMAAMTLIVKERADSKDAHATEDEDYPLFVSDNVRRLQELKGKLIDSLLKIKDTRLNGSRKYGSPVIANISFLNAEGESIILNLDFEGISVSSGSACTSRSLESSHVLTAMGAEPKWSHGAIRFSLSRETTEAEIDKVIEILPSIIEKLRAMSPFK